ncbi:MAG: phosphatidylglycerol lysyltransferase domain-containing protein [Erysipelotrichales bacterium]
MKKLIKYIFGLTIFIFAIIKLKAELSGIAFQDVYAIVQQQSFLKTVILILSGFIGITILGLYDFVLVTSQKIKVPKLKMFKISWISNSLNNLIGLGGIVGATIRYNFLQSHVKPEEIGELKKSISLLILSMITGVGVLSLLVVTNIFSHSEVLESQPYLKIVLLVLALALPIFLVITIVRPPVKSDRFLSLKYTMVSACDYLFVGLIMYLALRFVGADVSFWKMESVFVIATIAGLISMAPGGLGAFDVVFLLGMKSIPGLDERLIVLALVFYRLAYYILPFIIGAILSVSEFQAVLKEKLNDGKTVVFTREFGSILVSVTKKRIQNIIKTLFAIVFIMVIIFYYRDSGQAFLFNLKDSNSLFNTIICSIYIAFSIMIVPNVYGLLKGSLDTQRNLVFQLIVILICQFAIALQDQLFVGAMLTILLLISVHVLRGINSINIVIKNWKEKVLYLVTAYLMLIQIFYIYNRADGVSENILFRMTISIIVIAILWTIYSVGYRHYLRKQQKFSSMTLTTDCLSSDKSVYKEMLDTHQGSNLAHLGFLPNNNVMVDTCLETAIIYQENIAFVFILGDPIGNQDNMFLFINNLHGYATKLGKQLVFYQTSTQNIHIYNEFNYSLFNLGEEGEIDVQNFSITGNKGKEFRKLLNKQEQNELSFSIETPDDAMVEQLKEVSDAWLGEEQEMTFSVGNFDPEYLKAADVALVRDNESNIIAFASMMPIYVNGKISVDLIRWKEFDAIPMMDLLYLNLILWAQENEYTSFNIGVAPLSSSFEKTNSLLNAITGSVYMHSSSFYSFKGLRQYKTKFKPVWEPRYLIIPENKSKMQILYQSYNIIHSKEKKKKR